MSDKYSVFEAYDSPWIVNKGFHPEELEEDYIEVIRRGPNSKNWLRLEAHHADWNIADDNEDILLYRVVSKEAQKRIDASYDVAMQEVKEKQKNYNNAYNSGVIDAAEEIEFHRPDKYTFTAAENWMLKYYAMHVLTLRRDE